MKKLTAQVLICGVSFSILTGCQKPSPIGEPAAEVPSPLQPPSRDPLSQGLWWLYQLQYDKARSAFTGYTEMYPSDPAGYFYLTAVAWWEIAQNFELPQPSDRLRRFDNQADKTLRVAEMLKRSSNKSKQAQACFYEGGVWGLRGRLEVTQNHWLKAYHAGKQGRNFLKKALSLDPSLDDAYLGLGIYDYYAATLKGVQAVFAKFLMHGDRKRGLQEIYHALKYGKRAPVKAKLFLIDIYTSSEKQPAKALELARGLNHDFPQSPAMHLVLLSTLGFNKDWGTMRQEAVRFLEKAQKGIPFYNSEYLPAGLYYLGFSALGQKDAKTCIQVMNELLNMKKIPAESRWLSFAYLRRGEAYDLQGDHLKALADYQHVLARPDVWGSHAEASAHPTST